LGNEDTQNILDILSRNDIQVTFFMTGQWIEKYTDDVKAIAAVLRYGLRENTLIRIFMVELWSILALQEETLSTYWIILQ